MHTNSSNWDENLEEILSLFQALPVVKVVEFQEFLYFIEQHELSGTGVGFVDIRLLASARLCRVPLWTAGRRLKAAAIDLKLNYKKKT